MYAVYSAAYRAVYIIYTATVSIITLISEWFYFLRNYFELWVLTPICKRIPLCIMPDHLSWSRVPLAVGINFFLLVYPVPAIAGALYVVAWITDIFDGALARHRKQFSKNGGMIDPLADKILNGSILLGYYLFGSGDQVFIVQSMLVMVLKVDALLLVMAFISKKFLINIPKVKANFCGKCKFGFQCVGGMLLIFGGSMETARMANWMLHKAVIMGGMSVIGYIYKARNAKWR